MALLVVRRQRFRTVTSSATIMLASVCLIAHAQMPIGSVSTLDATVSGAASVANNRAQLGTNGTVIAKDHVAYVQLFRGGSVRVCATSGVHLTAGTPAATPSDASSPAASASVAPSASSAASNPPVSTPPQSSAAPIAEVANQTDVAATQATDSPAVSAPAAITAAWAANIPPPLMVALDRGAMEVRMGAIPGDIVMTPDLRFSFSGEGQLDVHIRVTRNGDTCVENRVAGLSGHPELRVGSLFGNESYNVLPGQHVLFEGGNLREVVDNESSPCGCPEPAVKSPRTNDLSLTRDQKTSDKQAVIQHPFPADVSQGLAPPPPVPQAPPGVTHTQIATTLVYPASPDVQAKVDAPSAEKKGFFHSIGRFFKHVF